MLLAGPVVTELETIFDNYWNSEVVYSLHDIVRPFESPEASRARFDAVTSEAQAPPPPPPPETDMFSDPPVSVALAQEQHSGTDSDARQCRGGLPDQGPAAGGR